MHVGRGGQQLLQLGGGNRSAADQEHTAPGEVQEKRKQHL